MKRELLRARVPLLLAMGLALAGLLHAASASGQDATPTPEWQTLAPIPQARSELAAAVIESHIYVVGGFGGGERVDRFDVETGEWQRLADLPAAVHHAGVAALDGIVYVAGGYRIGDMAELGALWAYDAEADSWEQRSNLPTPRGALGLAALDGRLYAVGGARQRLGGPVTGAVEVYDPATNAWERRAELPTPREHLAVVAGDGRLFAIGGRADGDEGDAFAAANEAYDPATDRWESLPSLPVPRGGLTGVYASGLVVVLGGERGRTTFADADAFDPETATWIALPPMPTARHGLASAAVSGTIYAITGSTKAGGIDNTPVVEALPLGDDGEDAA